MDIYVILLRNMVYILLSFICSAGLFALYNRFPPAWFMERVGTEATQPKPSLLRKFPDGSIYISTLTLISFVFFTRYGYSLLLLCCLLSAVFLVMISASDIKTGLIPDQFTLGLIFSSLFWMAHDIFLVSNADKEWYEVFTTRILAGSIGGGALLLIGIIGKLLMKKESVGMGDVKLLFACGLVVDLKGIAAVIAISFILALIPALTGILTRRKFFDRLPFAPFISAATVLYLLFPEQTAMIFLFNGGL